MPNPYELNRSHGPYAGRFLHLATGDGILAVDVQAAAEAIAHTNGMELIEVERLGAETTVEMVRKPRAAREFYALLRGLDCWEMCPHGYATVMSLSAAGPQRVGPFLIRAPWQAGEPDATNILIEPGLSFGLGTHATTRLPLRELAHVMTPGMRVADVGCGSGVLAIAMARLGAADVEAVDLDPVAVAEARANITRNGVAQTVQSVHAGSAGDLTGSFDLIAANMGGAASVIEIAPDVAAHLSPGGIFLASGIYGDTDEAATAVADRVALALAPLGLSEERRAMEHQCVGMVFRRSG